MADVNKEIAIKVTATDASGPALQSLEDKLNAAKKRMIELAAAGQQNTEEFIRLQQEAGEFKRTIEGVEQSVDSVAKSGVQGMQLFGEAVTAVSAGFTIATSVAALYGEENEDLQKTMIKVQASMALLQSVQALLAVTTKTSAVATTANRIALALYDKTLKGTIVSLRLFRTALIGTGIGAAVVAVGLLVENWEKLTKAIKNFLGIETKDLKAVSESAQRQVELAEARGEAEAKVQKLLMAAYDARIAAAEKEEERAQLRHEKEVARLTYETKLRTEANDKQKENAEKLKELDKDALKTSEELRLSKITNESEREKELLTQKLDALKLEEEEERKAIIKQITNEEQREQALLKLKEKYVGLNILLSEESAKKQKDIKLQERDTTISLAGEAFTGVLALTQAMMGSSEEDARKAFNLNKAASIADATVNTFLAATQALRDPKLPTVAKAFAVGGIIANGLAQVRKIAATQFKASGGGGSTPNISSLSEGSGGATSAAVAPAIFANPNVTDLSGFNQGQGQGTQPMLAYVVERDITQSTRRVRRLEEFATLGA